MGGGLRAAWGLMGCVILLVGCPGEVTSTGTFENPYGSGVSVGGSGGGGGAGGGVPVCHEPCIEQTSDVFDPGEVYLVGTLPEGGIVLAHWSTPGVMVAGLATGAEVFRLQLRPSEGRLMCTTFPDFSVRELRCDGCPFVPTAPFPAAPLDNDLVLPHPPCVDTATRVVVAPDSTWLLECGDERTLSFCDQEGVLVYTGQNRIINLGYDRLALTRETLLDLNTGIETSVELKTSSKVVAARARPEGGFQLVIAPDLADGIGSHFEPELYLLDPDGTGTFGGAYPELPAEVYFRSSESRLDVRGDLIQVEGAAGEFTRVVRRRLGGESEVVVAPRDEYGHLIYGYDMRLGVLLTGP